MGYCRYHCGRTPGGFFRFNDAQQLLGVSSGGKGGTALPFFCFARVRIVANASDNETLEVIHNASRFHLETECVDRVGDGVTGCGTDHELVARRNCAINYSGISGVESACGIRCVPCGFGTIAIWKRGKRSNGFGDVGHVAQIAVVCVSMFGLHSIDCVQQDALR